MEFRNINLQREITSCPKILGTVDSRCKSEMSINTHEDAFCLHKSVVLRQELSCKMNTGAHQECSGRISKVVSNRLKIDVHCKKAHFLMSFDRLVLFLFFYNFPSQLTNFHNQIP